MKDTVTNLVFEINGNGSISGYYRNRCDYKIHSAS